jgi:hypothetical protein
MFWNSYLFRYERLEELTSAFQAAGFRVFRCREEAGTTFFACVSAGGVEMLCWVTAETEQSPATFCWGSSLDGLITGPARVAVEPLLELLKSRGFFSEKDRPGTSTHLNQ